MSLVTHPYIAREGWLFIAAIALSGFVAKFYFGLLAALALWLLCGVVAFLFIDPPRMIPAAPLGVVCPADGEVIAIEQVRDESLERDATMITIRMKRLGSYVTRAPIEGKIIKYWFSPAEAKHDSGAAAIDRYSMWLQSDENDNVVVRMGVASKALKPVCYHQSGERIGQGERCGLVRFGGLVEVLLPVSARVKVAVGDRVIAGSDILAMLVHSPTSATREEADPALFL